MHQQFKLNYLKLHKKYVTRFFDGMRIQIYMIYDYSQMSPIHFAPDFYIKVQKDIG